MGGRIECNYDKRREEHTSSKKATAAAGSMRCELEERPRSAEYAMIWEARSLIFL